MSIFTTRPVKSEIRDIKISVGRNIFMANRDVLVSKFGFFSELLTGVNSTVNDLELNFPSDNLANRVIDMLKLSHYDINSLPSLKKNSDIVDYIVVSDT
jgi:hypothetical protein